MGGLANMSSVPSTFYTGKSFQTPYSRTMQPTEDQLYEWYSNPANKGIPFSAVSQGLAQSYDGTGVQIGQPQNPQLGLVNQTGTAYNMNPYQQGYATPNNSSAANTNFPLADQAMFSQQLADGTIKPTSMGVAGETSTSNASTALNAASGLASAIPYGSLALGVIESGVGLYGLSKMGKAPSYQMSPEVQSAYERAMKYVDTGFTSEEKGAYLNNRNTQSATAYQRGMEGSDGSQSGAIKAALNSQNLGADLNYASQDAQRGMLNRQYADSMADKLAAQQNLIKQQEISAYDKKQQAYAGALNAGLKNLGGAANSVGLLMSL